MALVILLFFLPLFLIFLNRYLFGISRLPPGPNVFQILPNISLLINKPHIALKNLSKIYGPLFSFRLGRQLVVVASSPDVAKELHKTHNRIFSGRHLPSVYYNVPGTHNASLVMSRECNDSWKFLRAIGQNSIFSTKAIEAASGVRKKTVKEMVEYLRNKKQGKIVDIEVLVYAGFTNIITNVLTSRDVFSVGQEGENDEKIMDFLNDVIEKGSKLGFTDLFPVLKRVDFWSRGRAMHMYRQIKLIWVDIIRERRDGTDKKADSAQDFLDVLEQSAFSDDQLSMLLTELLIAGTDSTTITAVWLMTELIKNQQVLHKVREEIDQAFEGEVVNEPLLSECHYFQACIRETLRLHIPGPFAVPHRATETCQVNNYIIPKDTMVLVNSWAIQTDPNNWNDALSFKPERFLDSKIDFRGSNFEFIPFSAGQRMCPGTNFAMRSVQLVVASLVIYFDWSLPNGEEPSKLGTSDKFGTTLKREKPLLLIPKLLEKYVATT